MAEEWFKVMTDLGGDQLYIHNEDQSKSSLIDDPDIVKKVMTDLELAEFDKCFIFGSIDDNGVINATDMKDHTHLEW